VPNGGGHFSGDASTLPSALKKDGAQKKASDPNKKVQFLGASPAEAQNLSPAQQGGAPSAGVAASNTAAAGGATSSPATSTGGHKEDGTGSTLGRRGSLGTIPVTCNVSGVVTTKSLLAPQLTRSSSSGEDEEKEDDGIDEVALPADGAAAAAPSSSSTFESSISGAALVKRRSTTGSSATSSSSGSGSGGKRSSGDAVGTSEETAAERDGADDSQAHSALANGHRHDTHHVHLQLNNNSAAGPSSPKAHPVLRSPLLPPRGDGVGEGEGEVMSPSAAPLHRKQSSTSANGVNNNSSSSADKRGAKNGPPPSTSPQTAAFITPGAAAQQPRRLTAVGPPQPTLLNRVPSPSSLLRTNSDGNFTRTDD
jgi:hypothetical protein